MKLIQVLYKGDEIPKALLPHMYSPLVPTFAMSGWGGTYIFKYENTYVSAFLEHDGSLTTYKISKPGKVGQEAHRLSHSMIKAIPFPQYRKDILLGHEVALYIRKEGLKREKQVLNIILGEKK